MPSLSKPQRLTLATTVGRDEGMVLPLPLTGFQEEVPGRGQRAPRLAARASAA
jgi:hypothetical protein